MATPYSMKFIVGAIDFGTTYSGYAFSTYADFKRNPLEIQCKTWPASDHVSLKAPTCVLFSPDKSFHSFGYEAEDKYYALAEEEEHKNWFFFRRFKMVLYNEKTITKAMLIKDMNGKDMVALDVFAACIRFLKDDLCGRCKNMMANFEDTDVDFVLTVPAIWDEPAKSFMREAALRAGIQEGQLKLVLEPEAASVYCRRLPDITIQNKYLMLDAGGGTTDIAVHEVIGNGSLREIHKANGGDWGGTKVDDAFSDLIQDIIGDKHFETFVNTNQDDWFALCRTFEVKKRRVSNHNHEHITFRVPAALGELGSKLLKKKRNKKYQSLITWQRDKFRIDAIMIRQLFDTSVSQIVSHLIALFQKQFLHDVKCIIMVGGFSESLMIQEAMKAEFERRGIQIVVPSEAGLAVLKGAVILGHKPTAMESRICRYTYGLSCSVPFVEGKHKKKKRIKGSDGKYYCDDIFSKIVEEGTEIAVNEAFRCSLTPLYANEKVFTLSIIATDRNITYTTDPGAIKLGKLSIHTPDTRRGLNRKVCYDIKFGDTELKVSAKDRDSGINVEAKFDFLSNSI